MARMRFRSTTRWERRRACGWRRAPVEPDSRPHLRNLWTKARSTKPRPWNWRETICTTMQHAFMETLIDERKNRMQIYPLEQSRAREAERADRPRNGGRRQADARPGVPEEGRARPGTPAPQRAGDVHPGRRAEICH